MNFLDGVPKNELTILGEEMRGNAMLNPCRSTNDLMDRSFFKMIAQQYSVCLMVELFPHPTILWPNRWHGSISLLKDITAPDPKNLGLTEQAMIVVAQWNKEEHSIAREILGYVLGPVILDAKQPIVEYAGAFSLHWLCAYNQPIFMAEA